MNRREFLKLAGKLTVSLGIAGSVFEKMTDELLQPSIVHANTFDSPVLVAVQLTGGNDGINTVVPYGINEYYDYRPTIAYKQNEVLPISQTLGFHQSMPGFKTMFDENNMAIIQGVGYPDFSRSHFRAQDIWQTASSLTYEQTGWLGRYLDLVSNGQDPLIGLSISPTTSTKIFDAKTNQVSTISDIRNFRFAMGLKKAEEDRRTSYIQQMYSAFDQKTVSAKGLAALEASQSINKLVKYAENPAFYPSKTGFSQNLSFIAQCISSLSTTKVYYTDMSGFDEHESERNSHGNVLKRLDQNLYAFYQDLKQRNVLNRVVILVYTEFGRRIKENASRGTDHGTAQPVFVIGGNVKGGIYGADPNFRNLDVYGDFKHQIDFRSVYSTIAEKCLNVPSKDLLFGKSYEVLDFI